MRDGGYDTIRALLASDRPEELRRGLELIRMELAGKGPRETKPLFQLVATLFYLDPLDRPDLLPVLDEALDLVAGFGEWVIPSLVEKLDAGDLKAQLAAGHALGRIGADAVQPLIAEYRALEDASRRSFILYALGKIRSSRTVEAVPLALEAARSAERELRDTATRALGKFAEVIPPKGLPEALRSEVVARLQANLADENIGIRAKAVRSLGKMARYGHLTAAENESLRAVCHRLLGDDGAFEWDRAFIVRREAEEALRSL